MSTNYELARMALANLTKRERQQLLTTIGQAPVAEPERILRRGEVARRLARTIRAVDRLAADGVLEKIRFPGRERACGFRASDVDRLLCGGVG